MVGLRTPRSEALSTLGATAGLPGRAADAPPCVVRGLQERRGLVLVPYSDSSPMASRPEPIKECIAGERTDVSWREGVNASPGTSVYPTTLLWYAEPVYYAVMLKRVTLSRAVSRRRWHETKGAAYERSIENGC